MSKFSIVLPRRRVSGIALLLTTLAFPLGSFAVETAAEAAPPPAAPPPSTPTVTESAPSADSGTQQEYRSAPIVDMPAVNLPPTLIFFPPVPPTLGAPIPRASHGRLAEPRPPGELTAYVAETFYAPLSSLLLEKRTSATVRRRLEAYRATRDKLVSDLQVELNRWRNADAATRQRELAAFARRQASELTGLEATAEQLRADLINGYDGWFAQRQWTLGENRRGGDTLAQISETMRGYAFYRAGLNPAQRGLLWEISQDLLLLVNETGESAQTGVFFSPAMARVEFPENLPASIAARITAYQEKKAALKKELYDAVYADEKASFLRGNVLKSRVSGQGPYLAEMEDAAEAIRRDLAAAPQLMVSKFESELSPRLTARVLALAENLTTLRVETQAEIDAIYRETKNSQGPVVLTYAFTPTGLNYEVSFTPELRGRRGGVQISPELSRETQRKMETATLAMASLADRYRRRRVEIEKEVASLQAAMGESLTQPGGAGPEAELNKALRASSAGFVGYANYRIAMLEPGLSPEQRRLLFGHALRELQLPLPPGELQPTTLR